MQQTLYGGDKSTTDKRASAQFVLIYCLGVAKANSSVIFCSRRPKGRGYYIK